MLQAAVSLFIYMQVVSVSWGQIIPLCLCKSVFCRLYGLLQVTSLCHNEHLPSLSRIILLLQDDYVATWHVGTKVVIGSVFLCNVLLSVHKKTAANCHWDWLWIAVRSHVIEMSNLFWPKGYKFLPFCLLFHLWAVEFFITPCCTFRHTKRFQIHRFQ